VLPRTAYRTYRTDPRIRASGQRAAPLTARQRRPTCHPPPAHGDGIEQPIAFPAPGIIAMRRCCDESCTAALDDRTDLGKDRVSGRAICLYIPRNSSAENLADKGSLTVSAWSVGVLAALICMYATAARVELQSTHAQWQLYVNRQLGSIVTCDICDALATELTDARACGRGSPSRARCSLLERSINYRCQATGNRAMAYRAGLYKTNVHTPWTGLEDGETMATSPVGII